MDDIEKQQLKKFLTSCGLRESLIEKFIENNITEDLFSDLLADTEFGHTTRQNLGLTIGDHIRLKKKLPASSDKSVAISINSNDSNIASQLQQELNKSVSPRTQGSQTPVPHALVPQVIVQRAIDEDENPVIIDENTPIILINDDEILKDKNYQPESSEEESDSEDHSENNVDHELIGTKGGTKVTVLEKLLTQSTQGLRLLNKYKKEKDLKKKALILSRSDRDFIVRIIIDHELTGGERPDPNKSISGARFIQIAEEILVAFPTETQSTYIRITEAGKFKSGSGKLYLYWANTRRNNSKTGLVPKTQKIRGKKRSIDEIEDDELVSADNGQRKETTDEALSYLKNSREPYSLQQQAWNLTYKSRRRLLLQYSKENTPFNYVQLFPGLQNDDGYKLLEDDFRVLYPGREQNLFKKWSQLEDFIIDRLDKKKKIHAQSLNSAQRATFVLFQLTLLFPARSALKCKTAGTWKPSKAESQEAFITHANVLADLDTKAFARMNKLLQYKKGLQPFIAIIGPSLSNITQTFVYLYEEHRYEVHDTLTALDVVFKCIHALHTPYAVEAQQTWQFIQRAVYEIQYDPVHNQYVTAVETLIKEFENYVARC